MKGFKPIGEILQNAKDGTFDESDLIELSPYNSCLFAYTMLKLPFNRFSPIQEYIMDSFYDPKNKFKELLLSCGRKCIAKGTLVFDKNGQIKPIEEIGFSTGIKPVYKLRTVKGKTILASKDHEFLTPEGWKPLSALKTGNIMNGADTIKICKEYPVFGNKPIDENRLKLIAYLTQDGYWTDLQSAKFTNTHVALLSEFDEALFQAFGFRPKWKRHSTNRSCKNLYATTDSHAKGSNPLRNWLKTLTFFNDFPTLIFDLPKEQLALFINRIFACCGCVHTKRRTRNGKRTNEKQTEICFADPNPKKLDTLRMLLIKFGIHCWIEKRKNENCSVLRIADSQSLTNFIKEIGMVKGKEEQCNSIVIHENHLRKRDFEAVKSIEFAGEEETFDMTVEPERYYIANGLIVHNSGKTTISATLLLYEVYKMLTLCENPQEKYGLMPREKVYFMLIGPSKEQTLGVSFDYVKTLAKTSPYLRNFITNETNEELVFEKNLVVRVQTSSSRGGRGFSTMLEIFDEIAHFIDNRGNLSGTELYYALIPNLKPLAPDSRSMLISSPAGKQGIFWEQFRSGMPMHVIQETPEHQDEPWRAVFQYPTWQVNPKLQFDCLGCLKYKTAECSTTCTSYELSLDYRSNPEKFEMEYGAQFCDTIDAALSAEKVRTCATGRFIDMKSTDKTTPRVISLDPALSGNSYALTMGHLDNDMIVVDFVKMWQGDREHPVRISMVEDFIEDLYQR